MPSRITLLVVPLLLIPLLCASSPASSAPITITGVVLLPDGTPAAGARVGLGAYSNGAPIWVETTSGPDGGFHLTATAGARPLVLTVLAMKSGYAPGWAEAAGSDILTLRLGDQPVTYHGRVCDPEGNPLPGATAEVCWIPRLTGSGSNVAYLARPGLWRATSDAQGHFSLADLHAGGSLLLTVSAPGHARVSRPCHVGGATAPFVLPPEATLSGRVLRQGQPVAGVKVYLEAGETAPADAITDAHGAYRLERLGTRGTVLRIEEPPAGWVAAPLAVPVLHPGDALTGLDFTVTPGAVLRGKVTDAVTGQPSGGASVWVSWSAPDAPALTSYATTGAAPDGTYEVRVPAGHVQVSAHRGAFPEMLIEEVTPKEFDAKEGQTREGVDLVVSPCPLLKGQLLRQDGTPALGLEVTLVGMQAHLRFVMPFTAKTNADGSWQMPFPTTFGPGTYLVLAQEPATGMVAGAWVDKAQDDVRLTLSPGAYVVCKATDPQGRPVKDVMVAATLDKLGPDGHPALPVNGIEANVPEVPTDAQGQARIGPLPPGHQVRVELQSDQYNVATQVWDGHKAFALTAGEEHGMPPLVIDREGRTLTGMVLDERGKPAAGTLVYAAYAPEAAETDPAGRFVLKHVPPSPPRMATAVLRGQPAAPPRVQTFTVVAVDPVWPFLGGTEVNRDQPGEAHLRLAPLGSASGQVVDEAGKPLAGVRVQRWASASMGLPTEAMMRMRELGGDAPVPITDAEGKWKVGGMIAGVTYQFSFMTPDGTRQGPGKALTSAAGEAVDAGTIVLKPRVALPKPAAPGELSPPPTTPPPTPGAGGPAPKD